MYLLIPPKYENIFLYAALLRDHVASWDKQTIKLFLRGKKLASFERAYQSRNDKHETVDELCKHFPYKFINRTSSGTITHGEGPAIMITSMKNNRIYFHDTDFYYLPDCISTKITDVTEILRKNEIVIKSDQEKFWANTKLSFEDVFWLEDEFQIKLKIWTKALTEVNGNKSWTYKNVYQGNCVHKKEILLHLQEETNALFLIQNSKKYFDTYLPCKNASEGCDFVFNKKRDLINHEKICSTDVTVRVVQKELGPSKALFQRAISNGLIPKLKPNRNFLFFDIESCLPAVNETTKKTVILNDHRLISIAVNRCV